MHQRMTKECTKHVQRSLRYGLKIGASARHRHTLSPGPTYTVASARLRFNALVFGGTDALQCTEHADDGAA